MNDYEIKKLYEDMEMYLIQSMKRNLGRHLNEENKVGFKFTQWQAEKLKELKRYQRENKKIIGRYTLGLDEETSEHLQNELRQGSINAIKQYNKILGKDLKPSKVMNKSFFRTNDKKVKALIEVVNNDLKTANTSALRMINDQYRQIIHKSAFFVGNGVFTEKQAVDEATKNFLAAGLNCIEYKDGRRVNIASYGQMAIRTASLRSQLMGEGNFRKSIGRTLVKVTTHGGACPLCTKWQGQVLIDDVYSGGTSKDGKYTLLSAAMKQGFLHPNCRHGITTYYPELEEDDEKSSAETLQTTTKTSVRQEETQQQLNYAIINAKRYRRLEKGSLAKENVERYSLKRQEWSNEARRINGQLNNNDNYIDVTNEWLEKTTPNSHKVVERQFVEVDETKYLVDGKNVLLDYSKKEKEVAEWLESVLGGEIEILPRIVYPQNIKTPDYLFRNEKYDLKEVVGNSKNTLDRMIKNQEKQAHSFIFDITNSEMSEEDAIKYIKNIYKSKHRSWVETIILKKDDKLIIVYKRKK
ncbi:MAG: hypothetical protein J6J11_01705 [Treponema sp.]|nr:hypothetical protein [Clostridia bacterium]MBP3607019.1 hypothetical protein [Treponema sp.]